MLAFISGKVLVRGRWLYRSVNVFNAFKSWKNGGKEEEGPFSHGSEKWDDFGGHSRGSPASVCLVFGFFDVFFVEFAPPAGYLQFE